MTSRVIGNLTLLVPSVNLNTFMISRLLDL